MQRKLYIDFDLLFDSISATAFGRGYIVPASQFVWGVYMFSFGACRIYYLPI